MMLRAAPWGLSTAGHSWTDQEDRLAADWLQRNGILVDVNTAAQAAQTVARTAVSILFEITLSLSTGMESNGWSVDYRLISELRIRVIRAPLDRDG